MNLDRVRKQQAEAVSKGPGNFFRPSDGPNIIRVFAFFHKVTKEDVKAGYFDPGELGKTDDNLARPVMLQFGLGTGGAPVHSTPETIEKYKEVKASQGKDAARKIAPNKRYIMNVVDFNDLKGGMKLFTAPKSVFGIIAEIVQNPEFGPEVLGAKGRDFIITFDKNAQGSDMYKVTLRDKAKSMELPDGSQKKAVDLYTDEAMQQVAEGWVGNHVAAAAEAEAPATDDGAAPAEAPAGEPTDAELDASMEAIFGSTTKAGKPAPAPAAKTKAKATKKEDPEVDLSALE